MQKIKVNEAGIHIKKAREEQNLSIRECAQILCTSAVHLNDLERGNRLLTEEEFEALSVILGLDFELDFDLGEDKPKRPLPRVSFAESVHVDWKPGTLQKEKDEFIAQLRRLNEPK